MSLSRREIELLVEEISPALECGAVQKVFEADPQHVVLQVRVPGHTHYLLIGVEPGAARLHFVSRKPRQPDTPAPFTMLLRKWVQGALIEKIEQTPADRIVTLHLSSIDPTWEPAEDEAGPAPRVPAKLVLELTGQQPNAILLDRKDRVIARLTRRMLGQRELPAWSPYILPAPPAPSAAMDEVRWELESLPPGQRSSRVEEQFSTDQDQRRLDELRQSLGGALRQKLRTLRRRLRAVEGDLSKIEEAETYRRYGELLQGAYGQVPKGAPLASVPDYYAQGMPNVEIPLDPAKSLKENIERYFHQYRRYKNAREQVEERVIETMSLIEALELAQREFNESSEQLPMELSRLEALEGRLKTQGLLPRRTTAKNRGPSASARALPYRTFHARSGATILVGRGAKHNDALSTHIARGRDLWLHARDWAGAHVVLRMDKGDEAKSEDILDAATLAAHFSKGRQDTLIDITHTLAKHVRKPKGFPPGLVTVAGGSTLTVRIDQDRLERLLATEDHA